MPARTVQATIDDCIERAFVAGADHFAIWGAGIDSAKADRVVKAVLKRGGSDSTLRLIQREAREAIMKALLHALVSEGSRVERSRPGITQPALYQEGGDGA